MSHIQSWAKITPVTTRHSKYYLEDGTCIALITKSDVLVNIPLGQLAERSTYFRDIRAQQKAHPRLGKTIDTAVPLDEGTVGQYEALFSYILPMSLADHRPFANRSLEDLQAIDLLTLYLGMPAEHTACATPLQDALEARQHIPTALTRHPLYYDYFQGPDVLVFLIEESAVLARLPTTVLCAWSEVFRDLLAGCPPESNSVATPVVLPLGTVEEWTPFLHFILPTPGRPITPFISMPLHDILAILRLSNYLQLTIQFADCSRALTRMIDFKTFHPAHALFLSSRYGMMRLRMRSINLLLQRALFTMSPDDVQHMNSFSHPPSSTSPFYCAFVALHSKVQVNRQFMLHDYAQLISPSPACRQDPASDHRNGCSEAWQWAWYSQIVPAWLGTSYVLPYKSLLREIRALAVPGLHPDCLTAMAHHIQHGSLIAREVAWVAAFVVYHHLVTLATTESSYGSNPIDSHAQLSLIGVEGQKSMPMFLNGPTNRQYASLRNCGTKDSAEVWSKICIKKEWKMLEFSRSYCAGRKTSRPPILDLQLRDFSMDTKLETRAEKLRQPSGADRIALRAAAQLDRA
ncbi:hypothetical protein EXIGLDRAFT_700726 [Exidia glandulosa HHB12029]|uniref:BTB domain-containing protein n=1 Tax=Exidia glandulosa HHB12029 TaxID=1314781 RepID=A0A165DB87_EXIGL|nr:hypothetical protein EXIGLDRAFT_700726 [Exidia glandulosa HHB12029]